MLAKKFKRNLLAVNIGLAMSAGFTGTVYAADEAKVKEWFENVNNTSALRGRFVKLHQILTYLSNGIRAMMKRAFLNKSYSRGIIQFNSKTKVSCFNAVDLFIEIH